jgi:hypothetical protein
VAEVTQASPTRLERYRDGDEEAVLALFRTVFGKARSLEHWRWQFKANPYGGPFVSMARRESDGLVVGSYSVMPVKLNLMGRSVLACQSVDTAVHPDHRGQRLFETTASDCYEWGASAGLKAVVGFPNASSYPGFMRTLGWRRIAFPDQHVLRLGIGAALARRTGIPVLPSLADAGYRLQRRIGLGSQRALLRRLAGEALTFRVHDRVPAAYEALWNACRSLEVLSVWKDTQYVGWRYDQNPDHRFTYFAMHRDSGDIAALAVGVDLGGVLTLCELMVEGRNVPVGRWLATEIGLRALSRGLRAVSFLGADQGLFRDVFEGFTHERSYANVFCGRAFDTQQLGELLPSAMNWTVTFGDGDFV